MQEGGDDLSSNVGALYVVTRSMPRYTFVAVAKIVESSSKTCILGRTTDISRKGCYVDTINPLPAGSELQVVIAQDHGTFATKARVLYVHPAIGMGVEFVDTARDQLAILDSWLAELSSSTD